MKKYLAPIIFAVLIAASIILYYGFIAMHIDSLFVSIIIILVIIALVVTMIAVLIQRIREIKKEEKDDISKY